LTSQPPSSTRLPPRPERRHRMAFSANSRLLALTERSPMPVNRCNSPQGLVLGQSIGRDHHRGRDLQGHSSIRDVLGDIGNWSFALKVVATKIGQAAPSNGDDRDRQSLRRSLSARAPREQSPTPSQRRSLSDRLVPGKVSTPQSLVQGPTRRRARVRDTLGDTEPGALP